MPWRSRILLSVSGIVADVFYAKLLESDADPDGQIPADREKEADFGGAHASYAFLPGHTAALSYLLLSNRAIDVTRHTLGGIASGVVSGSASNRIEICVLGTCDSSGASAAWPG